MQFLDGRVRVQVIDDDDQYKKDLQDQARMLGWHFDAALSPGTATRFVRENPNTLVVFYIDYNFNDKSWDGLGLVRDLKKLAPQRVIPYILTGSDLPEEVKDELFEAGAYSVLRKDQVTVLDLIRYANKSPVLELARTSTRDGLTGLLNRQAFFEAVVADMHDAVKAFERRKKGESPKRFSLLFMDLDGLKEANDFHGHEVGNKMIEEGALVLRTHIRHSDHPCRYGGDEFIAMLKDADRREANKTKTALQAAFREATVTGKDGAEVKIEMSIGISTLCASKIGRGAEEALAMMIRRADKAMYKDKARRKSEKTQAA